MIGEALVQSSNQSAATVKMSEKPLWHSAARVTVTATNDKSLQHVEKTNATLGAVSVSTSTTQ